MGKINLEEIKEKALLDMYGRKISTGNKLYDNDEVNLIAGRYAIQIFNKALDLAAKEAQDAIECYPSEQEEIKNSILKLKKISCA